MWIFIYNFGEITIKMITETKEIYKCEHCKRIYQIKRFAESHEIACSKNPDNIRACFGCKNLVKKDKSLFFDTYCGEREVNYNLCYCSKKEMFLYPPKVEHKGTELDLVDETNEPMPIKCDFFIEQY